MTPYNNLNVLAFYGSIEEQNHRKSFAYGKVFQFASPDFTLLPFQLKRETSEADITVCNLINLKTGAVENILSPALAYGLAVVVFDQYDLIINYSTGTASDGLSLIEGEYYLQISDGENTWFSDVFNVVSDLSEFMKITYWDNQDFAVPNRIIHYETGFKNWFYVKSKLGKPQYPIEEEIENRDGHKFFEKQISEKRYRFEFLAAEFLCDAIRIIRMHDNVLVEESGFIYEAEEILFTPEFLEQGDLAMVQTEFETGFIIKKIPGGGYEVEEGEVPPELQTLLGFVRYDAAQTLTEQEKQQARDNIGIGESGGNLPDGILPGGFAVQYSGTDFLYNIAAGSLRYQGILYNIDAGQQTAGSSDPDDDRINVLKVNSSGFGFEPGTPSENPDKPIDLGEGWFEITFVIIPAASTEPPSITNELVFTENTPPNWAFSFTGDGTANPNYGVNPYAGAVSILVENGKNNSTIILDNGANINLQNYTSLGIQVYLLAAMNGGHNFQVNFYNDLGNTISGGWVTLNVNRVLAGEWQFLAIDIQSLTLSQNLCAEIRIRFYRAGGSPNFVGVQFDNIILQAGVVPPANGGIQNQDIIFPIVERGTSKGVFWEGVTDKFGIYAVEDASVPGGAGFHERTTLVIEFGDNDSAIPEIEDRILIVQRAVDGVTLTPVLEIKKGAIDALVQLMQNGLPIPGLPVPSVSTEIDFTKPKTFGSIGSPLTATTLTVTNVGAYPVTQIIFHQAASLLIDDVNCFESEGSEDYDPARVAVIYIEYFSSTYKRFIITYDKP